MSIYYLANEMVLYMLELHQILLNAFTNTRTILLKVLQKNIAFIALFGMRHMTPQKALLQGKNR